MPDWTAPFGLPDWTDAEYEARKRDYNAREGYTITIPALEDIIHIDMEQPMTPAEMDHWQAKDYHYFTPARLQDIRRQKAKRKARYERMLADPTPRVVRNFQSLMTALDDTQDALNTIGVAGILAKKVAPKALSRLLTGPVGVVLTAADVINLIASVPTMCLFGKNPKQQVQRFLEHNSMTKKGRIKRAAKIRKWKPNFADAIQALQTTDQVFGFGVSLGPLVGLPISLASGAARAIQGEEVHINFAPWDWKHWQKVAMKVYNAMPVLWGYPHSTDDMEIFQTVCASHLAGQSLVNVYNNWNPLDAIDNLDVIEIEAPRATNILTREVITEGGHSLDDGIGWPSLNKQVASLLELKDSVNLYVVDNMVAHLKRLLQNWVGWASSEQMSQTALYTLALLESPDQVEFDYICAQKLASRLLEQRQTVDPLAPYSQLQLFADELGALDALGGCVEPQDLEHLITKEALPRIVPFRQPT